MSKKIILTVFSFLLFSAGSAQALTIEQDSAKIKFSGYFGFEMNEIMSGRFSHYGIFDHLWGGNSVANLTFDAVLSERVRLLVTMEGKWWLGQFPTQYLSNTKYGLENYKDFYLHQAQGIVSIINKENLSMDFSLGVIPYKYNPEARNLGEYLFRSLCYPGVVFNNFDYPQADLSGLRLNYKQNTTIGDITADVFALTERQTRPFGDISIAGVVDYKFKKLIDFGIGLDMYRVIPVNSKLTTPISTGSVYELRNPVYDSLGNLTGNYRDSTCYTFSGTKLMARATIDPLFFLRDSHVGKLLGEGGKIYGEIDILGLKSYPRNDSILYNGALVGQGNNPYGYDSLMNKMPIMVGINIPVPFLLDVCAVEVEYYQMRYADNYQYVFEAGLPLPGPKYIDETSGKVPADAYSVGDNVKWSVYMKKNITRNVHIVAQLARDHQRWSIPGAQWGQISDWDDICLRPNNWIWNLKGEFSF
jgi:hypothetical protein